MKISALLVYYISGKIVGGSNFQACAEKVRNKQNYLGTRINKKEDRQCGTGEESLHSKTFKH